MRLKNILKCGFLFLAAGMLLTGCGDGGNSTYTAPGAAITPGDSNNSSSGGISANAAAGNLPDITPKSGDLIATIEIEGHGTIKAVLFPDVAPVGVENFRKLADQGFYKGLTIHRVIDQFMFQGGSTNGDGTGGDAAVNGGSFGIETAQNARHFYGALCYANAGGQNSTQFYIVNNNEPQDLDKIDKEQYENIISQYNTIADMAKDGGSPQAEAQYRAQAKYYQTTLDWFESATDEIKAAYQKRGGTPGLDGNYTVFGQVYEGADVIASISSVEVTDNGYGEVSKPVKTIVIKDITVTEIK